MIQQPGRKEAEATNFWRRQFFLMPLLTTSWSFCCFYRCCCCCRCVKHLFPDLRATSWELVKRTLTWRCEGWCSATSTASRSVLSSMLSHLTFEQHCCCWLFHCFHIYTVITAIHHQAIYMLGSLGEQIDFSILRWEDNRTSYRMIRSITMFRLEMAKGYDPYNNNAGDR